MSALYERQNSPETALSIAEASCEKLSLNLEFRIYGKELKTYHCKLTDTRNNTIFYGCGKGLGLQSKVSACFEALEHHAVYSFCQQQALRAENYYSLQDPSIVNALKSLRLLDSTMYQLPDKIPFIELNEVSTGAPLYYPLFLVDPRYGKNPAPIDHFDYGRYHWNACDSGIASGTSFSEASLHALNETIERDAYSLFLIQAFVLNNKVRVIAKHSVPKYLHNIISYIEQEYDEELVLIDMTSDIGVSTIGVSMTRQDRLIQPMGCGTSLNREYALERALLESLQPLHIYNEHLAKNQKQILDNFSATPLLAQCAKADVLELRDNFDLIDFNSLPTLHTQTSVDHQLNTVIDRIKVKGFKVYALKIADHDTGFTTVKI